MLERSGKNAEGKKYEQRKKVTQLRLAMGALKIGMHDVPMLTEDIKEKCLRLVIQGMPFSKIAQQVGMEHLEFYRLIQRHPTFKNEVDTLREQSTHDLVDGLVERMSEHPDSKTARNVLQATQFVVAAKNRKDYGSRVDIHVTKNISFKAELDQADARLMLDVTPHGLRAPQVIETTAKETVCQPDTGDDHPLKARDRSEFEDLL